MQLIRGLQNLTRFEQGSVVTIGNFDGVHLGHQYVLGELAEIGANMGLPVVLIIFEPQPHEFFMPNHKVGRLTRFREKLKMLARLSIDRVVVIRFNHKFANLSADDFIRKILLDKLQTKYLVVGDDFRFGHKRQGDFSMLEDYGHQHGFSVAAMHTFTIAHERVSSTRIRQALAVGDLSLAKTLLGRPYRMCGRVAHGQKRGRDIGFPTANIHLHRQVSPIDGVFVVELFGIDGAPVAGIANLGTRPTVQGVKPLLEVHLFDFDADIYAKYVSVDFLHKIRAEKKFDSFADLKRQIEEDVQVARAHHNLRVQQQYQSTSNQAFAGRQ